MLAADDEPVLERQSMCSSGTPIDQTVTLGQAGSYRLSVHGRDNATGTYRVRIQSR